MPTPSEILLQSRESLKNGQHLAVAEASALARALADEDAAAEDKAAVLRALAAKGETADEVAGFALAFRELARPVALADYAARGIDIVGTGGDGAGSFNISTTASLLVASMGVPVLKHGNRSISSKCGSADLLEALGVKLEADEAQVNASLQELNFCFFFAPAYHPAFKSIMPVRKALAAEGQRTIFNLLGPLINPARPKHQLLGVFAHSWVQPMADALAQLEMQAALVVNCQISPQQAMDELTVTGQNHLAGVGRGADVDSPLDVRKLGLAAGDFAALKGGDLARNRELLQSLLEGKAPRALEDTVCLNAGVALWLVGHQETLSGSITAARTSLKDGQFANWLQKLQQFYAQ